MEYVVVYTKGSGFRCIFVLASIYLQIHIVLYRWGLVEYVVVSTKGLGFSCICVLLIYLEIHIVLYR